MKTKRLCFLETACILFASVVLAPAQTLINIDFGVGTASEKSGLAATGMGTNDFWNLYRHYEPKFTPGMTLVSDGKLEKLKFADRSEASVSVALANAPGVWGNASGDPMYDSYVFSQNGSNIQVTITGLPPGRYHFYFYGHADADVIAEQNSLFTLRSGTNLFGPTSQTGGQAWRAGQPWREGAQFIVMRDVPVGGDPVRVEVAPGPNGVAVLNGLQIITRGTSPPRIITEAVPQLPPGHTNLLFRDIKYDGQVSDQEARFAVTLNVESLTTNEISAPLFEGEVALITPELPEALRIVSQGKQTRLFCTRPGTYSIQLELVARITKAEPWNQISFTGPAAAMASLSARASAEGVEMQLLSGMQLDPDKKATSRVSGLIGADRVLAMRWQSKTTEITRKSLVTVDTAVVAQLTPNVVKYGTSLRYEVLQAPVPRLLVSLPVSQALTRIQGEQIRDWTIKTEGDQQLLTMEFIKPVEKSAAITLFSEQPVEAARSSMTLVPPAPLEVDRESGSITISADDTTVDILSAPGLRQVNAPSGALAAYRFNNRPISVEARVQRIEPVLKLTDRVTARLEETRLLVSHSLSVTVEKAGIYALEMTPQAGLVVSEVKGEGIEDWKMAEGKLRITFAARVLGGRKLDIQLEQAHRETPEKVTVLPLVVGGATNVTTQLGASSSPGIRLKTSDLSHLQEVPVSSLPGRSDELLAFVGEQPDWRLTLSAEKLSARIIAEVFNLVTVGDGLVGGSATIRYGIVNQGSQQFRVTVPAHWKNLEFTGANIRRKEQQSNTWTITLQDKAWGAYTLVLTYDYQFDPKGGTLDLSGAHPLDVERETGSLGIMTAASLNLTPAAPGEPLRRVDEAELSASDRALCTRPLLLAYKYSGSSYQHTAQVTRFTELPVLDAVADRIELTTVLTEDGQLLTQSSYMVKNNEKQFQRYRLPKNSEFWSSYVNGQPAKPERDGDWLLVPLPRDANRDHAFAVDIVYAQKVDLKSSLFPRRVELAAPLTDIPNTYAEWQLFVPVSQRLSGFEGNMTVARGTTYDLRDAWDEFVKFYGVMIERHSGMLLFGFGVGLFVLLLIAAMRRGFQGAVAVMVTFAILAILAAMMLPALSRAKSKAQRISAVNNLKQIGLAAKTWSIDNGDQIPPSFEAMKNEIGTDKVLVDPNTGQRFVYVGAGKSASNPEAILAYSPSDMNGRAVLFADGSVQVLNSEKFQEAVERDALLPRAVISANQPGPSVGTIASDVQVAQSAAVQELGRVTAQPAAVDPSTGLPVAGGFGGGGAQGVAVQPPKATATGVRPIRIDVPRTGQAFNFTKVLNAGQEPLSVGISVMRLKTYRAVQMIVQVCAFLFGLGLFWWFAVIRPNSFWMAVAAVLVAFSVSRLLIMWRLLHIALIASVPLLLALLIGWGLYRLRRRLFARNEDQAVPPAVPDDLGVSGSSTTALWLAGLATAVLGFGSAAQELPRTNANLVSITSATYTGTVQERFAQFESVIEVRTVATNQMVALFGDEVAVESFSGPKDARLLREGRTVGVLLAGKGAATLQLKLVARVGGDVTRRQLAFAIPPALSSRFSLVIDEPEAEVEVPSAVGLKQSSANQQTTVSAVLGASERFELSWTPRVKRAAEIAATVFAQNNSLVTVGSGVVNIRSTIDYQVSQGELKQMRIRVPSGQRLLRIEGEGVRLWEIKGDTLVVDLLKGASPAYKLGVETERVLEKLPATINVEIPQALDVKRETGLVGLCGGEELSLTIEQTRDLQRVDADEFQRATPGRKEALLSAFRFLKTDFGLAVRAEPVQSQVEALTRNQVRIAAENLQVSAQIDYVIKRAGVFGLRLALPAGYRLDAVTGTNISQWVERTEQGTRVLEVSLKERVLGSYQLGLKLARNLAETPRTLTIQGVHPLDISKLSGYITVSSDQGIAAKTQAFEGLTEIPFSSVPGERSGSGSSALAYKFITTEPSATVPWTLSVSTEAVDPWVRAEILHAVTFSETLVSGRTLLKYDIANAPIKEFRLLIPGAFRNVEISGNQIRRRDQTNDQWRIELQAKTRGDYFLTVTWEMPREAATNLFAFSGIEALGVERETGSLALVARPPLQVAQKSATELLSPIDIGELPEWAGRPDAATVLAYRYARPGYRLMVEAKRFAEAEVLQALIDNARLSTVIADDGQMMTEVALSIRNNGRQHLEVELPRGATVWSVFIAGEPVRPGSRDGKLLLPLTREIASDAAIPVELTFISTDKFPQRRGKLEMVSPRFDVPLKNARWDLYLPPDYEYGEFSGTMTRASDLVNPMLQVYSISEYNVQQKAQEEQKVAKLKSELSEARSNLRNSNLRQAISSFNRAKSQQQESRLADNDKDLKEVEQDLRRAQSSNLLNAQNDFFVGNYSSVSGIQMQQPIQQQRVAGATPSAYLNWDTEIAGQQWDKLAKAQQVAVSKVTPLRVNLPTRGVHYSFSQVLQTEVRKPMTINLQAENSKAPNWIGRILLSLLGFCLLWATMAFFGPRNTYGQAG